VLAATANASYRLSDASNKIESSSDTEIAAGFIEFELNKTGYNGLYRLNKKGKFNVPPSKYKKPI